MKTKNPTPSDLAMDLCLTPPPRTLLDVGIWTVSTLLLIYVPQQILLALNNIYIANETAGYVIVAISAICWIYLCWRAYKDHLYRLMADAYHRGQSVLYGLDQEHRASFTHKLYLVDHQTFRDWALHKKQLASADEPHIVLFWHSAADGSSIMEGDLWRLLLNMPAPRTLFYQSEFAPVAKRLQRELYDLQREFGNREKQCDFVELKD